MKSKPFNKKVRNATPTLLDGTLFRSKLEAYTYLALKNKGIKAEYEQHKFELVPAFTFCGKSIRAITITPDFVGDDFIIECKGHPNDAFPMKWKLFQWHLIQKGLETKYKLYIVHGPKEVDEVVANLK